jgi:glycosyltransferase involved in cell wall biosynthesis
MDVVIAGHCWFPRGTAGTARMRNLALGLRDCGARVHVIAMAPPPRVEGAFAREVREFEGVTYEHVAPLGVAVDGWLDPDRTVPRLRRRPVDRALWFASAAAAAVPARRRVGGRMDSGACDLLFVYDNSATRLAPLVRLARARGVPAILDVVETAEQLGRESRAARWDVERGLERTALRFDGLTVITTGLEAHYRQRACTKTLVLPPLEDWPDASRPEPTGNRAFRLTYVGALLARDAPERLIDAMRVLAHRGVRVDLDLVGPFEGSAGERSIRQRCAADPVLGRVVRFVGALSDAALRERLAGSDGLVLTRRPARTEELSFPTRLVELLRVGRPVLVSDVGDVARYLHDGEAVRLDPHDPRAMADAIAGVAARPDRGAAIGLRGRDAGAREFDRRKHAARLLEFVRGLGMAS